jgi:hypothetical protein
MTLAQGMARPARASRLGCAEQEQEIRVRKMMRRTFYACLVLGCPILLGCSSAGWVQPPAGWQVQWREGAAGLLLGAVIGSCIPLGWAARARRIERKGEVLGMQVEMFHGWRAMNALRSDQIMAPLYRLPLTMFERALPKLVGERKLTKEETAALIEYVIRAEEINRGLERAGAAHMANQTDALTEEFIRNLAKVEEMLTKKDERLGGLTVFEVAQAALARLTGEKLPQGQK